jgi:hypothetical protein
MPARAGRGRPAGLAWIVAALTGLAGCASVAPLPGGASPPRPERVEIMSAPFHAQLAFQCGPAALATALGHLGTAVSPQRLADDVFLPARQGSLQADMLAGARRHGAVATRIDPTLASLLREVAAGHPVVVLQNLGLGIAPAWHYAVVIGYDLPARELILHSGTQAALRMRLRTFEYTWERSGRWGFVATTPGAWPVSADRAAVVEAATGFERVARPADAVRAYASAVQRWPDDLALAAGLGNALHASGDLAGAALWFRRAAKEHGSVPAWINLSVTLGALGDWTAALDAAGTALQAADARWKPVAQQVWESAHRRMAEPPSKP